MCGGCGGGGVNIVLTPGSLGGGWGIGGRCAQGWPPGPRHCSSVLVLAQRGRRSDKLHPPGQILAPSSTALTF